VQEEFVSNTRWCRNLPESPLPCLDAPVIQIYPTLFPPYFPNRTTLVANGQLHPRAQTLLTLFLRYINIRKESG
jgi:hypothetical protein